MQLDITETRETYKDAVVALIFNRSSTYDMFKYDGSVY